MLPEPLLECLWYYRGLALRWMLENIQTVAGDHLAWYSWGHSCRGWKSALDELEDLLQHSHIFKFLYLK